MKRTSVHVTNVCKAARNRKFRDFAMALRSRKVSDAFEKRGPGNGFIKCPFNLPSTPLNFRNYIFRLTFLIEKRLAKDVNVRQCQQYN